MNETLILNVGIIAAIIVCLVVLHNPLALFGLLLLKELPYGLAMAQVSAPPDDPEPEGRPIGFIAS